MSKTERTNHLFTIFKDIIMLNQYRFNYMNTREVVNELRDITNIDISYIDGRALEELIAEFCNENDTGIYY